VSAFFLVFKTIIVVVAANIYKTAKRFSIAKIGSQARRFPEIRAKGCLTKSGCVFAKVVAVISANINQKS